MLYINWNELWMDLSRSLTLEYIKNKNRLILLMLIILDYSGCDLLYVSHLCLFSSSYPYQEYFKVERWTLSKAIFQEMNL